MLKLKISKIRSTILVIRFRSHGVIISILCIDFGDTDFRSSQVAGNDKLLLLKETEEAIGQCL